VADLGGTVKRWCQEESLSLMAEQDSEATLACAITLPGYTPLTISLRARAAQPGQVLLSHTAHMPLPEEVEGRPDAQERLAVLLERVAASRSALIDCRLVQWKGELATEIVATLHEEGATKQGFLVTLEEIRKVTRVVAWELEAMALTLGLVSEVSARVGDIVERTEALASDTAKAIQESEAATEPSAPQPQPPPAPAPPAGIFCSTCGRQAKPQQRFCTGCGTSLQG
jgi:hypothetical protein